MIDYDGPNIYTSELRPPEFESYNDNWETVFYHTKDIMLHKNEIHVDIGYTPDLPTFYYHRKRVAIL